MFGHTDNHTQDHIHGNGSLPGETRVTIRALGGEDAASLRELTERDTARMLHGNIVGAERSGRLMAAISLTSGDVVADPFHPTADLVALLRLRAGQILPHP
jgi:hypothetical protein